MIILSIAGHELRRLFQSPLSWFSLAVVQFFVTVSCFTLADQYQQNIATFVNRGITSTVVSGTLQSAGLLLLVTPFLTMRLISEERRSGTLALLLSAPIADGEIIAGKYLGIMGFMLAMLTLISLVPASLAFGTRLDHGLFAAGLLGLLLLAGGCAAIGLFASTLTRQPVLAAVLAFGLLFLFWVFHVMANTDNATAAAIINYLSMQRHYNRFLTGLFSSIDVAYFLLVCVVFVLLSILRLDYLRNFD
jgi:ABC-2 type transport system permease protein